MYPRWLNSLVFFFANESPQIKHFTLPSSSSMYQGVQSLIMPLVIVISGSQLQQSSNYLLVAENMQKFAKQQQV
jgi:hypothetical protein